MGNGLTACNPEQCCNKCVSDFNVQFGSENTDPAESIGRSAIDTGLSSGKGRGYDDRDADRTSTAGAETTTPPSGGFSPDDRPPAGMDEDAGLGGQRALQARSARAEETGYGGGGFGDERGFGDGYGGSDVGGGGSMEPPRPAGRTTSGGGQEQRTYGNGATFSGQMAGELRHGVGSQIWPDGSTYEGQWREDRADGEGTFHHHDGSLYVGQWMQDAAHGHGIHLHASGSKYDGQWQEDRKSGRGTEIFPDGTVYSGQYRNHRRDGKGQLNLSNGSKYAGDFRENKLHGFGVYEWADGKKYQGQYHENTMHGQGTFANPQQGESYEGQYRGGKEDGGGSFSWGDGSSYEGQWRQGKQHGSGTFMDAHGRATAGKWVDGSLIHKGFAPSDDGQSSMPSTRGRSESGSDGTRPLLGRHRSDDDYPEWRERENKRWRCCE